MQHLERLELARKISDYASLDQTEVGSSAMLIAELLEQATYLSDEFTEALVKEANEVLAHFMENSRIVETVETREYTYKSLEWYDD